MKLNITSAAVLAIVLLLTSALVVVASNSILLAPADANFNVVLDTSYKNMLGPGSYSQVFASKYPGGPAMHIETVCQAPVTSKSKDNVGACDGYNGPNFRPVLPKIGQHVKVTGRYLFEMPEMPGGITELHPVYAIKILP